MFFYEYWPAHTKLQQRAPQNHRTGFIIGRIVQALTQTENYWTYAGGKKQTHTILQGPCVATLCDSLVCHSFQGHTKRYSLSSLVALKICQCPTSPLLLVFSSPAFLSCSQSLEQFLCEFTAKLNKILSASSKFVQHHSISRGKVIHDTRLTLANSFNKINKTGREITEISKYFVIFEAFF